MTGARLARTLRLRRVFGVRARVRFLVLACPGEILAQPRRHERRRPHGGQLSPPISADDPPAEVRDRLGHSSVGRVTHDIEFMRDSGAPSHAVDRALKTMNAHADALHACRAAGVRIALGADLNPLGPRFHAEMRILEGLGLSRLEVLRAATVGGRSLIGIGDETAPVPGAIADLVLVDGDPLDDLDVLRSPAGVVANGRLVGELGRQHEHSVR